MLGRALLCAMLCAGCEEPPAAEDPADAGTGGGTGSNRCRFTATGDAETGSVTDGYDYSFPSRPLPDTIRSGTGPSPQGEYSVFGCRGSQNFSDPQAEQTSFAFNYLGRLPDVVPLDAEPESDPNLLSCFALYQDGEGNAWQCSRQQGGTQAGTCALSITEAEETGDLAQVFLVTASGYLDCPIRGRNEKGGTVRIEFTVSH